MGRGLISAFNPDLGNPFAHSTFGWVSYGGVQRGRRERYPCSFDGSEAVMRFLRRLLQHLACGLRVKDLLVHLLAEPAEFNRNDRKRFPSRNHADCVWAPHALAVRQLVVFLRRRG